MTLSHLDESDHIHMIDVGNKPDTERVAVACGEIHMKPATLRLITAQGLAKGDVLTTAHLAGVMAAKQTSHLIPLCHPLMLTQIAVAFDVRDATEDAHIHITATVRTHGKTGVEMEALTAVSVAALTIYDMAKAAEKTMRITNIRLMSKRGGKSGDIILENGGSTE